MSANPGDPASAECPGTPDRWLALTLLAGDYLLLYSQRTLISYLKSPLMDELTLTPDEFGWLGVAYHLPYAVAQIGAGYLGDRFSRRTVLFWSMILSALTLGAMGSAGNFGALIALRAVLGVTQSASVPAIAGAMADSFTPKSRASAVGIYFMAYNVGLVLAATLSGRIADTPTWNLPLGLVADLSGWRMAFILFAAASGLGGLLFWFLFPEPPRTEGADGAGGRLPFAAAAVTLLRTPTFLALTLSFVLWSMVLLAIELWLPGYVERQFLRGQYEKANLQATAWIRGATVAGLFVGGPLSDRLARRWKGGRLLVQMGGLLAMAPAVVAIGSAADLEALFVPMAIYGFGLGFYQANLWPTTFDVVDPAARSMAIGFLNVASGVIGVWCQLLIGTYQKRGGELGTALTCLGVPLCVALALLIVSALWLLPRDYRGPLRPSPT